MGNPIVHGNLPGEPFVSAHATIISERLRLIPNAEGHKARVEVWYRFEVDSAGWQIPFAFYIPDSSSEFQVWLDGKLLEVRGMPPSTDNHFYYAFQEQWRKAELRFDRASCYEYEADLSQGMHEFRVQYVAVAWEDNSEPLKVKMIRYLLSPAQQWRAFHHFRLEWQGDSLPSFLSSQCNLGVSDSGSIRQRAVWEFDHLPEDPLELSLKADEMKLSVPARIIVSGNFGLGFCIGLFIFGGIHLRSRYRYHVRGIRVRNPSTTVFAMGGGLVVLLCAYLCGSLVDGLKYLFIPADWFSKLYSGIGTVVMAWFIIIFTLMFTAFTEWVLGSWSRAGAPPPKINRNLNKS